MRSLCNSQSRCCVGRAWRVHGGGFAGTIQAFVPNDCLAEYQAEMERIFGVNTCYVLSVRPVGGVQIAEE